MAIYSAIAVVEEFAEHDELHSIDSEGTASVVLRCAWVNRHLAVQDILVNRRMWPHGLGSERPRANSVSVVPVPSAETPVVTGQSISYDYALLTVTYSSEAEADLISESLEPNTRFLTLDYKKFRWGAPDGDALLEDEAPGFQLKGATLVRTLFEVEPPLPLTILNNMGTVNDADYTSALLGLSFKKETLLYQPPTLDRTITTNQVKGWNIVLRFDYNEFEWNKFWRADTQEWSQIFIAGSSNPSAEPYRNFPLADMSDFLF